jgi:hypothetical protein
VSGSLHRVDECVTQKTRAARDDDLHAAPLVCITPQRERKGVTGC